MNAPKKDSKRQVRREKLFDFLAAVALAGDIATASDMDAHLETERSYTNQAIRDLRAWCGNDDTINLICVPQGQGEEWAYSLTESADEMAKWAKIRHGDLTSRLVTIAAVAESAVRATDGRTAEGKEARIIKMYASQCLEALALHAA